MKCNIGTSRFTCQFPEEEPALQFLMDVASDGLQVMLVSRCSKSAREWDDRTSSISWVNEPIRTSLSMSSADTSLMIFFASAMVEFLARVVCFQFEIPANVSGPPWKIWDAFTFNLYTYPRCRRVFSGKQATDVNKIYVCIASYAAGQTLLMSNQTSIWESKSISTGIGFGRGIGWPSSKIPETSEEAEAGLVALMVASIVACQLDTSWP
jgi:hypothetical protein